MSIKFAVLKKWSEIVVVRDENGVESFRFSGGKMETERKYENGIGNLQNGNGCGIFYAETETKTERCFPVEQTWKRNFPFP